MGTVSSSFESARRRSNRLPLRLTVTISGEDVQSQKFSERTETLEISKYGAKIKTSHELKAGTLISLERPDAERESQFRVVYQSPADPATGRREMGVEFIGVDSIWGVQFPPDKTQWV